jgi:hypothetical protein
MTDEFGFEVEPREAYGDGFEQPFHELGEESLRYRGSGLGWIPQGEALPDGGAQYSGSWTGSPDQLAFREQVLKAHIARSMKRKGAPQPDLRRDQLKRVRATSVWMRPEAAAAASRMLETANADLRKAQGEGQPDALLTIRLTANSGYRGSVLQRSLWLRYFKGYYNKTQLQRSALPGGSHSARAVTYMLDDFGIPNRIAAPGYSNHQGGIAIDFEQERVKGHEISNRYEADSQKKWRSSWFFGWLRRNAARFDFGEYTNEAWHWEYRPAQVGTGTPTRRGAAEFEYDSGQQPRSYRGGYLSTFTLSSLRIKVSVFCPKAAVAKRAVDVLVYSHGLLYPCKPVPKNRPEDFVTAAPFRLGEIVDASNRAIVLIVPLFDWTSRTIPVLGRPANLNRLVIEVLDQVGRMQGIVPPSLSSLILAGHSRAYGFLEPLAHAHADPQMQQGALARLSQVWGFDTTYVCSVDAWLAWLASKPNLAVSIFFRKDKPGQRSGTANCGWLFYSKMKQIGGRLRAVPLDSNLESHCSVPVRHLPRLLQQGNMDRSRAGGESQETLAVHNHPGQRDDALEYFNQRPSQVPQATPVLHLSLFRIGRFGAPITVTPSGFESFFCDPLPFPQVSFSITGRILMQQNGRRRPFTPSDRRAWEPATVVNRVSTGRGVSNSTSWVGAVNPDGTFATQSMLVVDPGTRRIRVLVTLKVKAGKEITADTIFQYNPLECFLSLMDAWEDRMPGPRITPCQDAAKHIEFLAAARKMFQPPPARGGKAPDPFWKRAFDALLSRNASICSLTAFDSDQGRRIRRYENIEIGDAKVDMGHVLTGIEGSRRQKPASILPLVKGDSITEALVTWAGDLGNALEGYAEAAVSGAQVDLQSYLQAKAGSADLLGDVDGINIGAIYDENKSLSDNLRNYYQSRPFRRFHDFLNNARNDEGKPLLRLANPMPPALDRAGRLAISSRIASFANGYVVQKRILNRFTQPQSARLLEMLRAGPTKDGSASKEMDMVVDYFFTFLENGLAKEAAGI